jgi:hypothetical protein
MIRSRRTYLEENLEAASIVLSSAEVARIDDVPAKHPVAGTRDGSTDLARIDAGSVA